MSVIIYCPDCEFSGPPAAFSMSLSDECWCPQCECEFQIVADDDDEEDDDDDQ